MLIIFTIGITSCKKIEMENQIDGIWKSTPTIYKYDDNYDEYYDFYEFDGDKVIYKHISIRVDSDGENVCEDGYEGTFKLKKRYLIIELPNDAFNIPIIKFEDIISIKYELTDTKLILYFQSYDTEYSAIYFKQ